MKTKKVIEVTDEVLLRNSAYIIGAPELIEQIIIQVGMEKTSLYNRIVELYGDEIDIESGEKWVYNHITNIITIRQPEENDELDT